MPKVRKIVILGPESTGKSTLTKGLAEAFGEPWVEEYAREYLQGLGRDYNYMDLLEIAKGQISLEEEKAKLSNKLLFCDTDLQVIKVWSDHKFHQTHPWILEQICKRQYDHFLLTDIDIPWQEDPLREHPEPAMRRYFFDLYQQLLVDAKASFSVVSGNPKERHHQSLHLLKKLI